MVEGKVAIITGGASGHGKQIATQFAANGSTPIIVDVQKKKGEELAHQLKEQGHDCLFIETDISDEGKVQEMVNQVIHRYDRIDILVNNAGITQNKKFEEINLSEWERMLKINLTGTFLCTKYVIPHMSRNQFGRIVNISSIAAIVGGGYIGTAHYAATKAGIIALTKAVAKDYAHLGITSNAIAPGLCATPMTHDLLKEKEDSLVKTIPTGRVGTSNDIANAILFLSSIKSDYITGQTLCVDGGVSIGSMKVLD